MAAKCNDCWRLIESRHVRSQQFTLSDQADRIEPLNSDTSRPTSLSYQEGCAKEADFDRADDQFALNKLPRDKNASFIAAEPHLR
jgi:hypothetical protein